MLVQAAALAAAATVAAADDAVSAGASSEAPMSLSRPAAAGGRAFKPLLDAALMEETVIPMDGEEAHLLYSPLKSEITLEDPELAGERKTRSPNVGRQPEDAKGTLAAARLGALAAIIAAIGVLLTAGGWLLTDFLIAKSKIRGLPVYEFPQIGAQRKELLENIEKLREAWQSAPGDVKVRFSRQLERYKQSSSDEAASASYERSFEGALTVLLMPADKLRKASPPTSDEEETTQRRQLLLVNAGTAAARVRLNVMTQMEERRRQRPPKALPSREELMAQATDLVTLEVFLQMAVGEAEVESAEEEGLEEPRIPSVLARSLADTAVESELTRAAAAEAEKMFAPFLSDYRDADQPLTPAPDLIIPTGGRFPTAKFFELLKGLKNKRNEVSPTPSDLVMEVFEDFSVINALGVLNKILLTAKEEEQITKNTILAALTTTAAGNEVELAADSGAYYRALLGLLDFGE
ncbi:hypothetical protein ACSSS7_004428 [Eimeria intestinalis]